MRFVADVWAVAQMSLGFDKTEVLFMAEKSQDLYRKAGLNTAPTGKMSTKQATNKLGAGQTRETIGSDEFIKFIFAYRKADNTMAVHMHGETKHFSTAEFSRPDDHHIDLDMWNYSIGQLKDIRDQMVEYMSLGELAELHIEESVTQTESAQTTQTMQGQDPMQMLTTALAMMSQSGASVDESQVEAIVERKLKAIKPTKVEVVSATATKRVEMAHKNFADAVALVGMGKNIALIGEAGSGKSFGAIQMAQALDLDYAVESCHGKMQSFDLVGAISPTTGDYISTKLRDAYENGKVLILDEFDRSNTETTIALNGILAGDCYGFPDGMVTRHKDFRVIACQNTFGTGASKTYASAKAQDGSTLTRFTRIEWNIDSKLETAICGDNEVTRAVQTIRENAKSNGYDQILITPRQCIDANQMVDSLGWTLKKAVQFTCLNGLPKDVQKRLVSGLSL
jgi:DNA replication protein DnaC